MTGLVVLTLMLLAPQSSDNAPAWTRGWSGVQALESGTPIRVVVKAGVLDGNFVAASPEVLVVELKSRSYRFDRSSIMHIDRRLPGSNRGQNMNRGLVTGLAVGLLRAKAWCDGCSDFGRISVTGHSMLIGTIVGAVSSAKRWETIYRR
jgi:hypothetical protein